jgi:hypothetical protein
MDKEKDEVSTRLRLPSKLHHTLGVLADLDDRSLHNYMIKVLQDHVSNAEKNLLDVYGEDDFYSVYISIFGDKYEPYIFEVDSMTELLNPQISFRGEQRGAPRSTGRAAGIRKIVPKQEYLKEREQRELESVAEESSKYNIDNNNNGKSDNS